jgi:hypothetical protein
MKPRSAPFRTQPGDGRQLGDRRRQFGLRPGVVDCRVLVDHQFFGHALGFLCLGLVQVGAADRGVGQDGNGFRLDFQDAAGDEDEFLVIAACDFA